MNSSRGAIWEQEKIDKLFPDPNKWFANPRTESRKIASLREALLTEKRFNSQAIAASADPKEIGRFRLSNADIDTRTGTSTVITTSFWGILFALSSHKYSKSLDL